MRTDRSHQRFDPPSRRALVTGLLLSLALAPNADASTIVPVTLEGDSIVNIGRVTTIDAVTVNNDGDWQVLARTDAGVTVLLENGVIVLRTQGMSAEGTVLNPTGGIIQGIDAIAFNNLRQTAFNGSIRDTVGGGSAILQGAWLDRGGIAIQSMPAPSPPYSSIGTYGVFLDVDLDNTGVSHYTCGVNDPNNPSFSGRAIMRCNGVSNDVVIWKRSDVLPGQTESIESLSGDPHQTAVNDSGHLIFTANLTGAFSTDGVIYLDSTLLVQEGTPSPVAGLNYGIVETAVDINNANEWVARVHLAASHPLDEFILKNGVKFLQGGDPAPGAGGLPFTSFGQDYTPILIDDLGRVVHWGRWQGPPPGDTDTGLFLSDGLIVQEGVSMAAGQLIDEISIDRHAFAISDNGDWFIFEAILDDGTDGAFLIGLPKLVDVGPPEKSPLGRLSAWPNPFQAQTTVSFMLTRRGGVDVGVFDPGGRRVATIASGVRNPGMHRFVWTGTDGRGVAVPPGVFIVEARTPEGTLRAKVVRWR